MCHKKKKLFMGEFSFQKKQICTHTHTHTHTRMHINLCTLV